MIQSIIVDGNIVENPAILADKFKEFFTNIAEKIVQDICPSNIDEPTGYSWFIYKMQQIYLRISNLLILIFYLIFISYLIPFFQFILYQVFRFLPLSTRTQPISLCPISPP